MQVKYTIDHMAKSHEMISLCHFLDIMLVNYGGYHV